MKLTVYSLVTLSALAGTTSAFVVPQGRTSGVTPLAVLKDPAASDHLVSKEANIKSTGRRTQPTVDPFNPEFERIASVPYNTAFPSSTKEYKTVKHEPTGHTLQVPFRRVHLEDPDQPFIDLYDTSGPQNFNPKQGLPKLRQEWVDAREGKHTAYTQMHFARNNMITEEMLCKFLPVLDFEKASP